MHHIGERQEHAFVFTRDLSNDYHFAVGSSLSVELQDAIVSLQDYFISLIDGIGFYSFPVGADWVTATSRKTNEVDSVGRAVYEIRGHVLAVPFVGEHWFDFAIPRETVRRLKREPRFGEEQPASWESLSAFLELCRSEPRPLSWGFGVRTAGSDPTGRCFDIRFVPKPPPSFVRRVLRLLRRAVRGKTERAVSSEPHPDS